MLPEYINFTEESNSEDYLEKAVGFIRAADKNPLDWKWVILALHGALYGFMICVLKGTDPNNNVCKKNGFLIDFGEALKRCQDSSYMNISGFTNVLNLSEHQKNALDYIHKAFRNQFLHYRPAMWFIELAGLPDIITHGLDIVALVALEMGNYPAHYDRNRIRALIAEGKTALLKFQVTKTSA